MQTKHPSFNIADLRVAIVCDWLTSFGGAERVIYALHEIFPQAPVFTTLYDQKKMHNFRGVDVRSSWLQKMPGAVRHYQWCLPFMPQVFEQIDLSSFDVVISSSHACAKGIITRPETLHISYCHSPMRYVWDNCHAYMAEYGIPFFLKPFANRLLHNIRLWDRRAADRVDFFIANSAYIAKRIEKYYRRSAEVIMPGIPVKNFHLAHKRGDYFLAVGRLTPYKKFDLTIEACKKLDVPLKIVGIGKDFNRLRALCGRQQELLGSVSEKELHELYASAQALIFPQVEDFGLVPVEAMASGCPVIAFKQGGACETVREPKTGLFFTEQTVECITKAIQKFQKMEFDPQAIRTHAESFDVTHFQKQMIAFITHQWQKWDNF